MTDLNKQIEQLRADLERQTELRRLEWNRAEALRAEVASLRAVLGEPDEIKAEPATEYQPLLKQFASLLMLANSKCRQAQHWRAQSSHTMHQAIKATAANVNAERDTNAILTDALEKAEAERDELRVEVEGLRKDAGRWKLVRSPIGTESALAVWHEGRMPVFGVIADRMVDEAIAKEAIRHE